jgi:RNA polymerase sigma factor (sigma-70 family)
MITDSQRLLAEYVEGGSETAFCELVTRYLDLVYSSAVRLMDGDTHRAEDVAQTVFADLARLARNLSKDVMLGGWLHRRTCHVAATMHRSERRRQVREQQAVQMNAINDHSSANLAQVPPLLDEAINQLGAEDRTAILLCFFEQNDFRSIGLALSTSEDAAQKRVSRALEKLHSLLKHRGVTLSAAALGTALATEAVTAAPAGLAVSIGSAALASAAVTGGTTLTLLKIITMTKVKMAVVGAIALAGVATPLVIQYQSQVKLREENTSLKQQVAEQAQLAQENQRLSNQLAEVKTSGLLTDEQRSELMRLRGEVGALRNKKQPSTQSLKASAPPSKSPAQLQDPLPAPTVPLLPVESWANVGTATPEASWQTLRWAFTKHDTQAFEQTVAWDPEIKTKAAEVFDAAPESARQKFGSVEGVLYAMMMTPGFTEQNVTGFGVASQSVSGDDATLIVQEQHKDGTVRQNPIQMHLFADGWRVITPPKMVDVMSRYLNSPELWAGH